MEYVVEFIAHLDFLPNFSAVREKNFIFVALLVVLQVLSIGSFFAKISGMGQEASDFFLKGFGNEVLPASQQGVVTASGYNIHSYVSFQSGDPKLKTAKGYEVNTCGQANVFKE